MIVKYVFSAGLAAVLLLSIISALRQRMTGVKPRTSRLYKTGIVVSSLAMAVLWILFAVSGDYIHLYRSALPTMLLAIFYSGSRR